MLLRQPKAPHQQPWLRAQSCTEVQRDLGPEVLGERTPQWGQGERELSGEKSGRKSHTVGVREVCVEGQSVRESCAGGKGQVGREDSKRGYQGGGRVTQ